MSDTAVDPVEQRFQAIGVTAVPSDAIDPVEARVRALENGTATLAPESKGKFSPVQAGLHLATGALASVGAGYRGLWNLGSSLASGKGWAASADAATNAVRDTQERFTTGTNERTAEVLASKKNPLNWIPNAAKTAGEALQDQGYRDAETPEAGTGTVTPLMAAGVEFGGNAIPMIAGVRGAPAVARTAGNMVSRGASAVADSARSLRGPRPTAQDVVNEQSSAQSAGAAGAAPDLSRASPELQQKIVDAAQQNGGAVNAEALGRHVEADSLPVKIKLTAGQAKQDPLAISEEQNSRGTNSQMVDRLNTQNRQLGENLQSIRDSAGPDVFSTNAVEHGEKIIGAYKAKDAEAQADIAGKYQALKDANGGKFPVDAQKLLSNATDALHDQLLFDHAPTPVMSTLKRLSDSNNMTFENFEALRTNLARIQRTATDGNERAAAGVIRGAMENLPLSSQTAKLKPLADAARAAAKAQFEAVDADPAYKAAVNDEVPADRFVSKYVINGNKGDVQTMRENLAHDPAAQQTLGVAALDHMRRAAQLDDFGNGNFSAPGFNKALQALSPKLGSLVSPTDAETLQTLGNVARYTQAQPRGAFVNNSNTFVAAAGEHAANIAESVANAKAAGLPVGTLGRKVLNKVSQSRRNARLNEDYGGLADLPATKP